MNSGYVELDVAVFLFAARVGVDDQLIWISRVRFSLAVVFDGSRDVERCEFIGQKMGFSILVLEKKAILNCF